MKRRTMAVLSSRRFSAIPSPLATTIWRKARSNFLTSVDVPLVPDFLERRINQAILQVMATNPRFRHVLNFIERGGLYSGQ